MVEGDREDPELTEYRQTLQAEFQTQKANLLKSHKAQLDDLEKQKDTLKKQHEEKVEQYKVRLNAMKLQQEQVEKDKRNKHEQDMKDARADLERKFEAEKAELEKQRKDNQADTERERARIEEEHKHEMQSIDTQLNTLRGEGIDKVDVLRKQHETEMQEMKQRHATALKDIEKTIAQEQKATNEVKSEIATEEAKIRETQGELAKLERQLAARDDLSLFTWPGSETFAKTIFAFSNDKAYADEQVQYIQLPPGSTEKAPFLEAKIAQVGGDEVLVFTAGVSVAAGAAAGGEASVQIQVRRLSCLRSHVRTAEEAPLEKALADFSIATRVLPGANAGSKVYKIYLTGGAVKKKAEATMFELSNQGGSWKWSDEAALAPMTDARYDHSSSIVGNKLVVVGGFANQTFLKSIEVYDFERNSWDKFTDPQLGDLTPRVHPAVAQIDQAGNRFAILGGEGRTQKQSDAYIVDLNAKSVTKKIDSGEYFFSCRSHSVFIEAKTNIEGNAQTQPDSVISLAEDYQKTIFLLKYDPAQNLIERVVKFGNSSQSN